MKKLIFILTALVMGAITQAAAVDWQINLTNTGYENWEGSTTYSYIITTAAATTVPSTVVSSWATNKNYAPNANGIWAGTVAGSTNWDTTTPVLSHTVGGVDLGTGFTAQIVGYVVVILDKGEGHYLWASYGDMSTINIASRGDTEAMGAQGYALFNSSSTWTEVGGVPEPTAFALLALGVAGLALRRKHA